MSNRVTITRTEFKNIKGGESSLGYRIYDEYGQEYNNCVDEKDIDLDDLLFLELVVMETVGDVGSAMLMFIRDEEKGIYIDDTWYDHDEIKHIFE